MSRFDKYDPRDGGFRAPLNAAWTATSGPSAVTDLNRILVVSLNGSGRLIKAASAVTGVGVVIATRPMAAGEMIDVMTDGEIVELDGADIQGGTAAAAGAHLILDTTASRLAAIGTPAGGTNVLRIGWTVEATRLIVRLGMVQG